MPAGCPEVAVEGDEVGDHHTDGPADPGNAVDQHSPAPLRLLSDDAGEVREVGEHVLGRRVLQGQLDGVEAGQTGQLLAHVDHEGGLQPGQGRARQSRGRAEVEIRRDLSDLGKVQRFNKQTDEI